jgi:hypothetical protein
MPPADWTKRDDYAVDPRGFWSGPPDHRRWTSTERDGGLARMVRKLHPTPQPVSPSRLTSHAKPPPPPPNKTLEREREAEPFPVRIVRTVVDSPDSPREPTEGERADAEARAERKRKSAERSRRYRRHQGARPR